LTAITGPAMSVKNAPKASSLVLNFKFWEHTELAGKSHTHIASTMGERGSGGEQQ